jgi:Peptidase family S41
VGDQFPDLGEVTSLEAWRRGLPVLPPDHARAAVDAAIRLLGDYYVHLPVKQAVHGIDPIRRLRVLRDRLPGDPGADTLAAEGFGEEEFQAEMHEIFASLRDYHTRYLAPPPYRDAVAFLPFHIERCWEGDAAAREGRYLVTKVHDRAPAALAAGAAVTHWNGTEIERAVRRHGETTAGCSPVARHARSLEGLTARTLDTHPVPAEDWVWLGFVDADGRRGERKVPWLVSTPTAAPSAPPAAGPPRGIDQGGERRRRVRKALFAGGATKAERDPFAHAVSFRVLRRGARRYGHLRLWTFAVGDADGFVARVAALLAGAEYDGLIVDVRGNLGGSVQAAERLLQLISPRPITPERFTFRATGPAEQLADGLFMGTASFEQSATTGEAWSTPQPVTGDAEANDTGQLVGAPCVLLVDPLVYSAADMFAAGFQDHEIGPVIGTASTTGAGGGIVLGVEELNAALPDALAFVAGGERPGFTVAVRRSLRVRLNAGRPVEDLGVRVPPEAVHATTRRDVLEGNVDLLAFAITTLAALPRHALHVEPGDSPLRFRIGGSGVAWVEAQLDGLTVAGAALDDGGTVDLTLSPPSGYRPATATFRGFAREPRAGDEDAFRPVVTVRLRLRDPSGPGVQ